MAFFFSGKTYVHEYIRAVDRVFFFRLITGSIEDMAKSSGLTTNFLSIVLLPLAGNAVEHITAVMVAMKNKMDLALGIAIGSSIQIALFVLPTCVLFSWGTGGNFTLELDGLGMLLILGYQSDVCWLSSPKRVLSSRLFRSRWEMHSVAACRVACIWGFATCCKGLTRHCTNCGCRLQQVLQHIARVDDLCRAPEGCSVFCALPPRRCLLSVCRR
jgi:hypothetical protein